MELKGLKGIFLGDSITEGVGASSIDKVWWKLLEKYGLETVGYGVGGTRIAPQDEVINGNVRWNEDFITRAKTMDKQADIVAVFGGTNDYGHGTAEIGFPTDDTPKGKRTPEQQAAYERQTVTFYDIDKKGWRSMRIDTIWSYNRALKLTE